MRIRFVSQSDDFKEVFSSSVPEDGMIPRVKEWIQYKGKTYFIVRVDWIYENLECMDMLSEVRVTMDEWNNGRWVGYEEGR
jgi:hypothetical protein